MVEQFLPYLSVLLQWARARQRFKEIWYATIVVASGFLFYWIADPTPFREPAKDIFSGWWEQARLILAMTQIVSTASNIAVDTGVVKENNAFVPVTDSKS